MLTKGLVVWCARAFFVLCFSMSMYCYAMNNYEFDTTEVAHRIECAQAVSELAPVTATLLGVARFAAERIKFDDGDSCLYACYTGGSVFNRKVNKALQDFYHAWRMGYDNAFVRNLNKLFDLRFISEKYMDDVREAYETGTLSFRRDIEPLFCANIRRQILARLTDTHHLLVSLHSKPGICAARTIAATCILLCFVGNLGCTHLLDITKMDQLSEVKRSLQSVQKTLFDTVTILSYRKRRQFYRSCRLLAPGIQSACVPATFFNTLNYERLYAGYVPRLVWDPLEYLSKRYDVYYTVRLKPEPISSMPPLA